MASSYVGRGDSLPRGRLCLPLPGCPLPAMRGQRGDARAMPWARAASLLKVRAAAAASEPGGSQNWWVEGSPPLLEAASRVCMPESRSDVTVVFYKRRVSQRFASSG